MASRWHQALVLGGVLLSTAAPVPAERLIPPAVPAHDAPLSERVPPLVARVNEAPITRDLLLERLDHYLVMLGTGPSGGQGHEAGSGVVGEGHVAGSLSADRERELLAYILKQIILEQLKAQEAARLGIVVPPELLEANVSEIVQQAGSRDAFEAQLRQGHTTPERWRAHLQQTLLLQEVEARRRNAIAVTDEEVRRYWDKNRAALSAYFHADQPTDVEGELRDMLKDARWPATQEAWEAELAGKAAIWIDPLVRTALWGAAGDWRGTP